jgi:hypothetical protein
MNEFIISKMAEFCSKMIEFTITVENGWQDHKND